MFIVFFFFLLLLWMFSSLVPHIFFSWSEKWIHIWHSEILGFSLYCPVTTFMTAFFGAKEFASLGIKHFLYVVFTVDFHVTFQIFHVVFKTKCSALFLYLEFFTTSFHLCLGVFWEGDDVCKSKSDGGTVTTVASGSKPNAHKGERTLPSSR